MGTFPREEWERLCAELSAALQGRAATFELADPEHELAAAGVPFDGLRLEDAGEAVRLLALAGGRALVVVDGPTGICYSPGAEGAGATVTIEAAGAPVARIAFAPLTRVERPLRERSVGGA